MSRLKIVISSEALNWFNVEMEAAPGDAIRFFARYGGSNQLHTGFSLGVTKEEPDEAVIKTEHNGVLYYIESRDKWFFVEHDLHVNVDPALNELVYTYEKA